MQRDEYEGIVQNFRLGLKTQRPGECLIIALNIDPSMAGSLVGWYVAWPLENPKLLGKIVSLHGKTGTLKVKFRKGLPGQALGSRVKIVSERRHLWHTQAETQTQTESKVQVEVKPLSKEKAPPKTKALLKPEVNLSDIKGVGKKTEEKLRNAGYKSPKSIARARTGTLSKKTGLSEKVASKIIDAAKELVK